MKYFYLKRYKGIFYYYENGRKYGFRLTYYDANHQRHEKSKRGFKNSRDAIKGQRETKDYYENNKSYDFTVKQYCNRYLKLIRSNRKKTTYYNYLHLLTEDIIPYLGNTRLSQLRMDTYQSQCLNKLFKRGLSRKTVINANARFQAVINSAIRNQYLTRNPIAHAKIANKNTRPKKMIMNDEQLAKFNQNLTHHSITIQVIYQMLEHTGMRAGELLGLKWKDINFKNRIIRINHTRDDFGYRSPKTKNSKRKFAVSPKLIELLKKYFGYCKKRYNISKSTFMILNKYGKPLVPNFISHKLKRLLIECGLKNMVSKFTPHSFRHMFASRLISNGVNIIAVSKMLGHANPDITMKIYAQAKPNQVMDIYSAEKQIKK